MRQDLPAKPQTIEQSAGQSKLLSRLYRDVGLAAVAAELNLQADALEPEIAEALERGASSLAKRSDTCRVGDRRSIDWAGGRPRKPGVSNVYG